MFVQSLGQENYFLLTSLPFTEKQWKFSLYFSPLAAVNLWFSNYELCKECVSLLHDQLTPLTVFDLLLLSQHQDFGKWQETRNAVSPTKQ